MKIFISWSGTSSRLVAEALSDWLQRVIQAVKPFYSPDIDKGAKWSNEIDKALEGTRFGIICLTPDNLESSWIHYEAGALSKTNDASIWTFLLELKPSDVKQPLGRFQHTLSEKADALKMLKSINAKLVEIGGESLRESLLEEIFEESWAKLETRLNQAKESIKTQSNNENNKPTEIVRNENDKLDEILDILRSQQRSAETYKPLTTYERLGFRIVEQPSVVKIEFSASKENLKFAPEEIISLIKKVFLNANVSVHQTRSTLQIKILFSEAITENDAKLYISYIHESLGILGNEYVMTSLKEAKHIFTKLKSS